MIRRILSVILLVGLVAGLAGIAPVRAAGGLAVLSSSAEMDFPTTLTFEIAAASVTAITDIRLNYTVERREHARIVGEFYIHFTPSTSVEAEYVWDMRMTGGLPPGASLRYWWQVTDAEGSSLTTVPQRVVVADERYDWNSLTEGQVTLYWYEGNDAFAAELMEAAQQGLEKLEADTGAVLADPVRLYIYANYDDLRGSMIYPQEWTGGVAFTQYGAIAIGIEPNVWFVEWGKGAIVHELTHLVIHQLIFNPYNDLPTWLDEGLAMVAMGELDEGYVSVLEIARENDQLISVRSLASPFSSYAGQSTLAYAQSYELVKYLIDTYGSDRMFELLSTFRQGSGCDAALLAVYGFDMDGLDAAWRATLE
jgi:hypothetical protein